ncbi:cyclic nucleotide-binding domain-containing protein [Nisaea sp.]|uniref:cyclic nucleotide-binding domain-containing protein n=1 Tax=Nisaea sp. TaxID=2024842 RepID=UPI003B52E6E4
MDNTPQTIAGELEAHPTFSALPPDTIAAIASAASRQCVGSGTPIMQEGEENSDLFLITSGTAAAERKSGDGGTIELNDIRPGDCIGELTFLDGGRRSASVRAKTDCEFIRISASTLSALPDAPAVVGELKGALAGVAVRRARVMSDDILAALREQLEIKTLQNQFGQFLIFTIAIFLISTGLFYLVAQDYVRDVYDPGFSWQTVIFLAVPCLTIIKLMKIPLADLGIRKEGFWRSLGESVAICTLITVPALIYYFGFKPPRPEGQGATIDAFFLGQYFLHTIFQEVGSRGLLQGLFQKFLDDRKGHKAIFMTSTVFSSLHITFGADAVLITFFASIVFGYVYLRQKNLVGVTVMHFWLGVLAAMLVAF